MAEVLGLVSAIGAIVELTAKLGGTCVRYIDSVRKAPKVILEIQGTVTSLEEVLEDMKDFGDARLMKSKTLERVLSPGGELEACKGVMIHLQKLIDKYIDDVSPSGPGKKRLGIHAGVARAKWPLTEHKIRELLREMEQYHNKISEARDMESAVLNAAVSETVNKMRSDQVDQGYLERRRKVVEWLIHRNYAEDHKANNDQRLGGTGQWLLESTVYQEWLDGETRTLFCRGMPGAGKTFITAAVIEDLHGRFRQEPDSRVAIVYLYFNYRQEEKDQRAECLLSNLLGQLTRDLPPGASNAFNHVRNLHDLHNRPDRGAQPSLADILKAFHHVAAWYDRVFIVADALDECKMPSQCERLFSRIVSLQSQLHVRIFATSRLSREGQGIDEDNCLSLEIRASDADIGKYLDDKMPDLRDIVKEHPGIKENIKRNIISKADGIFLLAQLYMEHILRLSTVWEIEKRLDDFKKGNDHSETLALAYKGILDRIDDQGESARRLAQRALTWVTFATTSLTDMELRHALAVDKSMTEFEEKNLASVDKIVTACCGLLSINKKSHAVRLAHFSTKEYLESPECKWLPKPNREMAETCITYLSFREFSKGPIPKAEWFELGNLDTLLKKAPLLRYASFNWAHHLSQASDDETSQAGKDEILHLLLKLSNRPENLRLSLQVRLLLSRERFPAGIKTTHIVSYLGTPAFLRALSKGGTLVCNERDGSGRTAMHWAILRKDGSARAAAAAAAMVSQLLELKFDIDAADVEGRTPLHYASKAGDVAIVLLLLDRKAKTEVGRGSVTPLIEACCCGHAAVVRELLRRRANVNVISKGFGTPLSAAILGSSEDCVAEILGDPRLKKYHGDYEFGTALHEAACHGQLGIVTRLLDAGFDPNKTAGDVGTPLQVTAAGAYNFAQAGQNVEVARLLLDRGADVNAPGGKFGTALEAALGNDHGPMEELLRSRGAAEASTYGLDRRDSFLGPTELDLRLGQRRRLPKIVESQVRHFITAVMMDNEKVIKRYADMEIRAFREAVQSKNVSAIDLLCRVSVMAFEQTIDMVKYDMEGGDVAEGSERAPPTATTTTTTTLTASPPGSGLYTQLLMPVVGTTAKAAAFISFILGSHSTGTKQQRQDQQQQIRPGGGAGAAALHAVGAAGSKLELMTSTAVLILTEAIIDGDEEIIQMLSKYWASALRLISFPGKASDRMMEVLVTCRVEEFEGFFRENKTMDAKVRARLGVELLASAIQGRRGDAQMAQLAVNLAKIWSLALRNVVEKDYISYSRLEEFMRGLQKDFTAGVELHNWRNIERFGTACLEILVGMVADENATTAHIMAQMVTEGWQHALDHGGEHVIDKVIILDLVNEFWISINENEDEKSSGEEKENTNKSEKDKARTMETSRAWNVAGTMLKILHTAGRHGLPTIAAKISEVIAGNLDRASRSGKTVGVDAVRGQMLKSIVPWCKVDPSPVYYFEAMLTLLLAAQRTSCTAAAEVIDREIVAILRHPSRERDVLTGKVKEVTIGGDRPDDAAQLATVVRMLRENLTEGDILADEDAEYKFSSVTTVQVEMVEIDTGRDVSATDVTIPG